jgi:pimeloyl-ACP methyl ester carboxylesterase
MPHTIWVNKLRLLIIRTSFRFLSPLFPRFFGRWAMKYFLTPLRYKVPGWEKAVIAKPHKKVERGNYTYYVFGEDGDVVLFVHGWAGRGTQFGNYVNAMIGLGYRVVLFDGPAHGANSQIETDLKEFSGAIINCQSEFGELAAVVGHSFGGSATGLALHMGLRTRKAVLMATPANLQRVFDVFSRTLGLSRKAKNYFTNLVKLRIGLSETEASIVSLAPQMKIPVLVVHDPRDKEVNYKSAEEIKALWPGATLYAPERVGHYRLLKDVQVIKKVVEFIVTK